MNLSLASSVLSNLNVAFSSFVMMYPTSFFSHSLYFFGSFVESLANATVTDASTVINTTNLRMRANRDAGEISDTDIGLGYVV
jgi:hypothetical protein